MSNYSMKKKVDLNYEDALEKVKAELKEEGFGVLSEIDMKQTFKDKIGEDFNKYIILGACNPKFAYKALQMEEDIGLLLPCNVVVYTSDSGDTSVAIINPMEVMNLPNNQEIKELAKEIKERLERVIKNM
ncbi:DUF302 domain-containing protein [Halanaerobiaceae bacterium Z-7014]|uniref:DUF302 domain-containing protein n=1 Tax=Halonatronomonas betaini TaxID=2778430 RepID=A0A931APX4_9FIRM|nr:DUF302 domain-containing protein [Halonatronomonas betaini]MBF8435874.1 DUF302 domain-containing protein [Halonatronomonas betaini]